MKTPSARHRPDMHILVCTNQRSADAGLPCCANAAAQDVVETLRKALRQRGAEHRVWLVETKCLTFCSKKGASLVVYPQDLWFHQVRQNDCASLLDYLLEGKALPEVS